MAGARGAGPVTGNPVQLDSALHVAGFLHVCSFHVSCSFLVPRRVDLQGPDRAGDRDTSPEPLDLLAPRRHDGSRPARAGPSRDSPLAPDLPAGACPPQHRAVPGCRPGIRHLTALAHADRGCRGRRQAASAPRPRPLSPDHRALFDSDLPADRYARKTRTATQEQRVPPQPHPALRASRCNTLRCAVRLRIPPERPVLDGGKEPADPMTAARQECHG